MEKHLSALDHVPVSSFVATEQGLEWLETHPELADILGVFCREKPKYESAVKGDGSVFLGEGQHSQVWDIGGAAVKISTFHTGKYISAYSDRKYELSRPENLINQFHFLDALSRYLESSTEDDIRVPKQLLALRTNHGSYLKIEEEMTGWTSIYSMGSSRAWYETSQEHQVSNVVKSRILDAVPSKIFRLGLRDLGINPREHLHAKNILIPEGSNDLNIAPLCIIDQPGKGFLGRMALGLVPLEMQAPTLERVSSLA